MSTIISLTTTAIERLQKILQKAPQPAFFRISVKPAGCSGWKYVTEIVPAPQTTDKKLEISGITIYLAADAVAPLQGTQLDVEQKGLGAWQWQFKNPNAIANCGCGESFTFKEGAD